MTTDDEVRRKAQAIHASGLFPTLKSPEQAYVLMLAGEEMGVGPIEAVTGIVLIQGKPTMSANLLAALVKRHPRYDFRVIDHDDSVCRIEFAQDGEPSGVSEFTLDDAKRAGLSGQTWSKYPAALLFARALTQGVRWYCPDVTAGPAYTPEELGGDPDPDDLEGVPVRPIDELGAILEGHDLSEPKRAAMRLWLAPDGKLDDDRVAKALDAAHDGRLDDVIEWAEGVGAEGE